MSEDSAEQGLDLRRVFSVGYMEKHKPPVVKKPTSTKKANDLADMVNQEISSGTPEEIESIREFSRDALRKILEMYGKYITYSSKEDIVDLEKRIILSLEDPDFIYNPSSDSSSHRNARGVAVQKERYSEDGFNMVVLADPSGEHDISDSLWESLNAEDQESALKEWGGITEHSSQKEREDAISEAKSRLKEIEIINTIIHEILHQHESYEAGNQLEEADPEFSHIAFQEIAVRYYTLKVMDAMDLEFMEDEIELVDYYQQLVDKYGEEFMAGMYFGTKGPYTFDTKLNDIVENKTVTEVMKSFHRKLITEKFPDFAEAYNIGGKEKVSEDDSSH